MTAPQLKLTYFDAAGRAELVRLVLAFGNVPFVDERVKEEDGLYPQDAVAALRVDMIVETLIDLTMAFIMGVTAEKDEALKAEKAAQFINETAPKALGVLESMVEGKFFGGDSISLADVHLYDLVKNGFRARAPSFSSVAFPKLEAVMENVKANANIAAYLAKSQQ
ncbi:hypothetical protein PybrP1_004383 [[Pythium] brassicae (nom. inval.)]|nr:hypothetical protein PybrP1_004383 [[Pythium] brassicae (nom. inval.)]